MVIHGFHFQMRSSTPPPPPLRHRNNERNMLQVAKKKGFWIHRVIKRKTMCMFPWVVPILGKLPTPEKAPFHEKIIPRKSQSSKLIFSGTSKGLKISLRIAWGVHVIFIGGKHELYTCTYFSLIKIGLKGGESEILREGFTLKILYSFILTTYNEKKHDVS